MTPALRAPSRTCRPSGRHVRVRSGCGKRQSQPRGRVGAGSPTWRARPPGEETTMNEAEVFVLADRALAAVVARIRPDQWDMTMPADFASARCGWSAHPAQHRQLPRLRRCVGARHAGRPHHGRGRSREVRRRPPGRRPRRELRCDRRRGLRRRVRRDRLRPGRPPVLRRLHRPPRTSGRSTRSVPCGRTTSPR